MNSFDFDDWDYMQSAVQQAKGFYEQDEYVVRTPDQIEVKLIKVWRKGTENYQT